jgi:hypothetical protein
MGISECPCPFLYRDSPYGNGERSFGNLQVTRWRASPFPVSIWRSPYGNGDRHIPIWKGWIPISIWSPMAWLPIYIWWLPYMETGIDTSPYGNGVSPSIPVSIWGSKWNGYPFLYGDPRIETGPRFRTGTVQSLTHFRKESLFPFGDWGKNHHMGMYSIQGSPFPYGDYRTEMGRETRIFPYGESPFPNRVCFHLGINIYMKRGLILKCCLIHNPALLLS